MKFSLLNVFDMSKIFHYDTLPCFTQKIHCKIQIKHKYVNVWYAKPQKKKLLQIGITMATLSQWWPSLKIGPRYAAEKWPQRAKQFTATFDTNLSKSD